MCSLFYLLRDDMLISFCPIPKCLTTHLSYYQFFLVNEAPCALVAKTKTTNHKGRRWHFQRSYVLALSLSAHGGGGSVLEA